MTKDHTPPKPSLLEVLETLDPIDEDFPEIEELPPEPVDLVGIELGSEDAFRKLMELLASRRRL